MTLRMDIPEGAEEQQLPRLFGFGRIQSLPALEERYVTVALFGWRLFVASGIYDILSDRIWPPVDHRRSMRWWFARCRVVEDRTEVELQSPPRLKTHGARLLMGPGPVAQKTFEINRTPPFVDYAPQLEQWVSQVGDYKIARGEDAWRT